MDWRVGSLVLYPYIYSRNPLHKTLNLEKQQGKKYLLPKYCYLSSVDPENHTTITYFLVAIIVPSFIFPTTWFRSQSRIKRGHCPPPVTVLRYIHPSTVQPHQSPNHVWQPSVKKRGKRHKSINRHSRKRAPIIILISISINISLSLSLSLSLFLLRQIFKIPFNIIITIHH